MAPSGVPLLSGGSVLPPPLTESWVSFSLQGPCKDNLHYSSVVFNHESQDSKDNPPSQKPRLEESEYTVIRA